MTIDQSVQLRSRRLTGRIGAEISGLDLADLDDDQVVALRHELLAHRVVFFRGPDHRFVGARGSSPLGSAR